MARNKETVLRCKKCKERYILEHAVEIAVSNNSNEIKCPYCNNKIGTTH